MPFESAPEEEQQARRKRSANAARVEARNVMQDVLCAAPGRLGQVELTRGALSGLGGGDVEEEVNDES